MWVRVPPPLLVNSLQKSTFFHRRQKAPGLDAGGFGSSAAAVGYERATSIAAAWSRMSGSTWEYVSSVMAIVACPSISETIFGFTLRVRSSVAQVCRRSWKRISGRPACFSSGLNFSAVTARLSRGSPVSDANIRPFSLHREPRPYLSLLAGAPGGS